MTDFFSDIDGNFRSVIANMSVVEFFAVITAIIYVVLASFEKIGCWAAGIISSILYLVIMIRENYLLEAILQLYYIGMGIYGWISWQKGMNEPSGHMPVRRLKRMELMLVLAGGGLLTILAGYAFSQWGSSRPYMDATTTVFAVITTWMVTRKILENWLFWIAIDAITILLYSYKELYLSMLLFAIYIVIAVFGYIKWRKTYVEQHLARLYNRS